MATKEESLFFRNVEQWLQDNPGKSLADWRKEVGYTGPALKKRGRVGEIRVSYKGKSADAAVIRTANEIMQRAGEDVYGKGIITPKGSGLEEHHKRVISVYQPFFEGLNNKEKRELAQWFVDEGAPLGNVEQNLTALTKPEHKAIHDWMKENYIQSTGKPLLNFKDVPLNERLPAALMFLENVQPAVDEQLSLIQKGGSVKFKPPELGSIPRLNAKNLAIAGLLSYGALGTAASAAETTQRSQLATETGNPLDVLQAGIAGVSSAADIAAYNPLISPAAETVSTIADVTNLGIDVARSPEGQQAMQKWANDPLNELEYWGKRGLKTLGGAMHYFKLQ